MKRGKTVWPSFAQQVDPVLVKMRDTRRKKSGHLCYYFQSQQPPPPSTLSSSSLTSLCYLEIPLQLLFICSVGPFPCRYIALHSFLPYFILTSITQHAPRTPDEAFIYRQYPRHPFLGRYQLGCVVCWRRHSIAYRQIHVMLSLL